MAVTVQNSDSQGRFKKRAGYLSMRWNEEAASLLRSRDFGPDPADIQAT